MSDTTSITAGPLPAITVFPLAEAAKALAVSEGRHFKGKLILKVR